jgi:hypothetical protein
MRALVALLGLLAITWLEFQVYPGHSYLKGDTQCYVPMLERLDAPGFLSRDLVATNPTFVYTIYDEVTLALHQYGGQPFQRALEAQQLLFRFAAVLGIYLLVRSAGVGLFAALLLSAFANAISLLIAPGVFLTNPEPVPGAFAMDLVLLAVGCLTHEKPLLGGLAGGIALIYDPLIGGAFWLVLLTAMILDRQTRWLFRAALPSLLIFGLLLANLSQLQPGLGNVKSISSRFTPALADLSRMRTPNLWPSLWVGHEIWSYLFLFIAMLWAAARIWRCLNRQTRWLCLGLASLGLVSIPLAASLLAFSVVMASVTCGIAAWRAMCEWRYKESAAWSLLVLCITLNPQILNLPRVPLLDTAPISEPVRQLAQWAERDTWGSSMFLFPDAGRSSTPSIFRALSRRALWADWQSGVLVNYSDEAGREWWKRWQMTMQQPYSAKRVEDFLSLPIDYYVVEPKHKFKGVRAAFENKSFAVYDAQDLRNATGPLESAHANHARLNETLARGLYTPDGSGFVEDSSRGVQSSTIDRSK